MTIKSWIHDRATIVQMTFSLEDAETAFPAKGSMQVANELFDWAQKHMIQAVYLCRCNSTDSLYGSQHCAT